MPFNVSGNLFINKANEIKERLSAKNISSIVVEELKQTARDYNWRRFDNSIFQHTIDENTELINISNLNNSKTIAGFLQFGTPSHGPAIAKALRFKPDTSSKFIFRKRVKGINPFEWWGFNPRILNAIHNFINQNL